MTCNDDNVVVIVRGNDTDWNGVDLLTVNLNTEILDLSTMKAEFILGNIVKTFDNISSGQFKINYTAQETANLPPFLNGVLKLIDTDKRIATIESLIPFKVISVVHGNAIATEPYTLNFDVKQGDETILTVNVESAVTVEVGTTTTLPAGSNATVENVGTGNHLVLNFGIPKGEDGQGAVQSVNGKVGDVVITINDLTTSAQQSALNSGANTTNIGQITTNKNDISTINGKIPTEASESNQLADKNYVNSSIKDGTLTIQRNNSTVGTFSANQSSNETINISVPTQASDINAVPITRTVNNKALSSNITLTASDVGALSSSTTINDLTTEAQQNALNSGATSAKIGQIATNTSNISTNAGDIATINGKIPSQASDENQLADKNFVNSSISTNTANFIGTFDSVEDLEAYSGTLTNNDYAFVVGTDSDGNTVYNRYKYTTATTPASWEFEYALNNSSFTAAQWASINSGATTTNIGLAESALQPNDNISELVNDTGYITGITSSDVTTALGYTPYNSSNPDGYTSNVGTVTSVNNTQPDGNGNVSITIPTVNDATLTIQKNGTTVNTFTANASSNVTANITVPTDVSDLTNTTLANKNLSNLSEAGDERLHALKSYKDSGELLTDAEGLANVKEYAHSTFDASKFTVVGSPTITSDGIASGFSASNNINTGYLLNTTRPWVIYSGKVQFQNVTTQQTIFCSSYANSSSDNNPILVNLQATGKMRLVLASTNNYGSSAPDICEIIGSTNFSANTDYWFKLEFTGTKYNFYYSTDGKNYSNELNCTSSTPVGSGYIQIGLRYYVSLTGAPLLGSIDLKQFSITVDGVEVFCGNKTGIDTIKPDDYTVVGTPTISADGVVSGFSASNYIQTNYTTPATCSSYYECFEFTTSDDINTFQIICGCSVNGDAGLNLYIQNGTLKGRGSTSGTGWDIWFENGSILANTDYKIEVIWNGSKYIINLVKDNIITNVFDSNNINFLVQAEIYFGNSNWFSLAQYFLGSINLNTIKIYVNGDLVYQPCLKIPYTFSKTGSKIVDSIYRNRVSDMYSQFGYANYYTLSDTDYTLPQGEIYGNIQQTLRNTKQNGIAKNYLYSDRMQIQTGSCTSGTEVTLPVPFADSNYALTVPYSAKTASKFTPTQTGDWIAIGLGVL